MTLAALNAHLDAAISDVWRDCLQGVITEGEAAHRVTMLTAYRSAARPAGRPLRAALPISRFTLRRCQRSPDREASRTRRRMLARDGRMPPGVRAHYTEGEAAALTIIAGEIKRHGCCDLPIDRIAAQAGVGRTTVQNAIREARRLGHLSKEERPVKGRKSLTNVVRIISREWLAWIERGPAVGRGFKTLSTFNFVNPTKSKMLSEGRRREHGIMTSPSPKTLFAGHVPIGEIRDAGPGKVPATYIAATGKRESLGFHRDRSAAREAIEARHAGGPEPPRAR